MKKMVIKTSIAPNTSHNAAELLSGMSGLSKAKVKDAMNKGAFWIKDKKGKLRRIRKATYTLYSGNSIEFYYNDKLLSKKPPAIQCVEDLIHYSVWLKPAGLMSQGTKYGDHCSLLRQVEVFFNPKREVFLVHRLDMEASGLMLIAHNRKAASKLSGLFQKHQIIKEYHIEVLGNISNMQSNRIELPLDDKPALTEFKVLSYNSKSNTSMVTASITTGRYHQIRRHFNMIGHPVIGDPKYGKGNKNSEGLRLSAVTLSFLCPFANKKRTLHMTGLQASSTV